VPFSSVANIDGYIMEGNGSFWSEDERIVIDPERRLIVLNYLSPFPGAPMVEEPVPPGGDIFAMMNLSVPDEVRAMDGWAVLIHPNASEYQTLLAGLEVRRRNRKAHFFSRFGVFLGGKSRKNALCWRIGRFFPFLKVKSEKSNKKHQSPGSILAFVGANVRIFLAGERKAAKEAGEAMKAIGRKGISSAAGSE